MKKLAVIAGLLLWAVSASANPVTAELIAFLGQYENGIPTYPYALTINNGPDLMVMCDDYWHGGEPGDVWQANLTVLTTNNRSLLRFDRGGTGIPYKEAAWIMKQFAVTDKSQWPDMNYAVWGILSTGVPLDNLAEQWVAAAKAEAEKGFPHVNFGDVMILTPVDIFSPPQDPQEFMFLVPEPASFVLLGSAVVAAIGARRRFRLP